MCVSVEDMARAKYRVSTNRVQIVPSNTTIHLIYMMGIANWENGEPASVQPLREVQITLERLNDSWGAGYHAESDTLFLSDWSAIKGIIDPWLFEAIALEALACTVFPGFGDKTRRIQAPSGLNPYFVPIYPDQSDPSFRSWAEPPAEFEMKQEAIELKRDSYRFEDGREVCVRWGYGPESDALVVTDGPIWRRGHERT